MRLATAIVAALALLSGIETPAQDAAGQRQRPLPGGSVQRPARDAREPLTGTSIIRGRVVTADTGAPIRRVNIRAFSGELRESRATSTDGNGRYELKDLPAGRWELTASKAGFVTLRFGQRRPFEAGRPIELGEDETMARADFALPRGAAITGRIVDEYGDPVAGARVQVSRFQAFQGTRRLVPAGMGDQTDDTGAFRLYGLSPGEYYVSATLRGGFIDDSNDTTGYAPTYYPGTGNLAEAQRIGVSLGQEAANISFALLPTRTVRVSGRVVDSQGRPLSSGFVMLVESIETSAEIGMMSRGGGRVRADGSFTVANVTPGSYTLQVGSGPMGGDDAEFASLPITVGSDDLTGIHLVTGKGTTLTGVVQPAQGSTSRLETSALQVVVQSLRFEPGMGRRPARVERDGTFRLSGLSGQRLIRLNGLPSTWMLRSVLVNGADVTDTPLEFKGQQDVGGVQVIVTDRLTEVTGKVTDAKGEPTRDYTVIVFPEDPAKWTYPSRYVKSGRADQDGLFKIRALPPEDRYLAVAVDYLEDGEGSEPEFLRQMISRATSFGLSEGDARALDLRIVPR